MSTEQVWHIDAERVVDRDGICHADVRITLPKVPGRYGTFQLGWSPQGVAGRRVFQGPMVTDLFGWVNESCMVIDGRRPEPKPALSVAWDDLIEVEGVGTFRVLAPRAPYWSDPKIEVVLVDDETIVVTYSAGTFTAHRPSWGTDPGPYVTDSAGQIRDLIADNTRYSSMAIFLMVEDLIGETGIASIEMGAS